jgi:hypothetical protein
MGPFHHAPEGGIVGVVLCFACRLLDHRSTGRKHI